MLKKYSILILVLLFVSFSNNITAQNGGGEGPPEPGGGGGPVGPTLPPRNPIDGGLGFLVILGIGYAVKSIRKEEE
jgi:hypothetical protein